MYVEKQPLFMICETPLHVGSGSDLGVVDLPIQRERHTDFPKVESSSLKGCLREAFKSQETLKVRGQTLSGKALDDADCINLTFGPENAAHAGALGFTDARILLFPVKSMRGVYAWITCPRVLERLQADLKLCGIKFNFDMPRPISVPKDTKLVVKDDMVVLEEYAFKVNNTNNQNCTALGNWLAENVMPQDKEYKYWRTKVREDIIVLSDDDFRDFVNLSTEVITRIKIKADTGTVQGENLFTEEYLPAESILYSLAMASPLFLANKEDKKIFAANFDTENEAAIVLDFFFDSLPKVIQLGGNATIGKGIIRTNFIKAITKGA